MVNQVGRVIACDVLNRSCVIVTGRIGVAHLDRLKLQHLAGQVQNNRAAAVLQSHGLGRHPVHVNRKVAGGRSCLLVQLLVIEKRDVEAVARHHRPHKAGCSGVRRCRRVLNRLVFKRGRVVAGAVLNRHVVIAHGGIEVADHHRLALRDRADEFKRDLPTADGEVSDFTPFVLDQDFEGRVVRLVLAIENLVVGQDDVAAIARKRRALEHWRNFVIDSGLVGDPHI